MRNIARLLIAEEVRPNETSDSEARAAIRVCDKLGRSLSTLAGARGAQSLQARALALGAREAAWLSGLKAADDGTLTIASEAEAETRKKESATGGVVLVTTLLELLVTFIGEALTLRLVQRVWPKAALSGGKNWIKA